MRTRHNPDPSRGNGLIVRQIVVTALIAAGTSGLLAASQTVTPLWPAAPERSAHVSAQPDDAVCPEATFGTDSAQDQKSSKPSANNSPLVLSAPSWSGSRNPRGGIRQDTAYAGRLLVSSAVDLDRFIRAAHSACGSRIGKVAIWPISRLGPALASRRSTARKGGTSQC